MQPLDLQEHTLSYLKDLIHICLQSEAQGCGMTFNMHYVASKSLISYHTEANGGIFFATGVPSNLALVNGYYIRTNREPALY